MTNKFNFDPVLVSPRTGDMGGHYQGLPCSEEHCVRPRLRPSLPLCLECLQALLAKRRHRGKT